MLESMRGGVKALEGGLVIALAVIAAAVVYSIANLDPYAALLMTPFFALGCAHGKRPLVLVALSLVPALVLLAVSIVKFNLVGVPLVTYDHYFLRKNVLMLADNDWRVASALIVFAAAVVFYIKHLTAGRGPFSRFERTALGVLGAISITSVLTLQMGDQTVAIWDPAANTPTLKTFVRSSQVATSRLHVSADSGTVQLLKDASAVLGAPVARPDIFMVLEESTLPPAALSPAYEPHTLFAGNADQTGPLRVHTFAGGTWRTEFSLVTQMLPQEFGSDGLYVFQQLAGRVNRSIFTELKALGYRTMVFYPVAGSFINAATFYRSIGVDEFYDPESLGISAGWAWTIPDAVLYQAMLKKAAESDAPVVAFMLTINQHGPHDYQDPVADYLKRFTESDRAYGGFLHALAARGRPAGVVAFGDHQPEFTARFIEDGLPRYLTGYDIRCVNFKCTRPVAGQAIDVVMLAPLALERFGFSPDGLSILQQSVFKSCSDNIARCDDAQQRKFNTAFSQFVD